MLLTASLENGCGYSVAVHSTVADLRKDDRRVTDAIRDGEVNAAFAARAHTPRE